MTGLWSAEQREWLEAMGYAVLTTRTADPAVEPATSVAASVPAAGGVRSPAPARSAPRSAAPAVERAAPRSAPATDTPLLRAVRRAAGLRPDETHPTLAELDLSTLRGNAAAKRALWPRLRALRGGAPGR